MELFGGFGIAIGLFMWLWVGKIAGQVGIHLGADEDATAKQAMRAAALAQYKGAYVVLIVTASTAVALWTTLVAFYAMGRNTSAMAVAIDIVAGAGNTALFGFALRVWKECRDFVERLNT